MAYFNHAFGKAFLADSFAPATTKSHAFAPGAFEVTQGWASVEASAGNAIAAGELFYLVQGSFHTSDKIGNNPGHGGYTESVKSKGINPRFVSRLWSSACKDATPASARVSVGSTCAPCGSNLYLRLDVKGSPALRFVNHNVYALGDSAHMAKKDDGTVYPASTLCCAVGQEYLDPAVALAKAAHMLLADPLIAPFAAEGSMDVTVGGVTTTYTIAEVLDGTYTPSVDPVGDDVSATVTLIGAYVDTKFGNCSFDTRDFFEKEPVQLRLSVLDETGDPCNDCGEASWTPGSMAQTTGETVLRDILLTGSYMQDPFNQGNVDSARIREIQGSDAVLAAIDRNAYYKVYYVQHSIPRLNNPSSMFDNDQYVYAIYVKCSDTAATGLMDVLMGKIEDACAAAGNPVVFASDIDA